MGYRDSIELIDDVACFNELLKKGNRKGRLQGLPAGTDAARYRMSAITKVLVMKGNDLTTAERGVHCRPQGRYRSVWIAHSVPGRLAVPAGPAGPAPP